MHLNASPKHLTGSLGPQCTFNASQNHSQCILNSSTGLQYIHLQCIPKTIPNAFQFIHTTPMHPKSITNASYLAIAGVAIMAATSIVFFTEIDFLTGFLVTSQSCAWQTFTRTMKTSFCIDTNILARSMTIV